MEHLIVQNLKDNVYLRTNVVREGMVRYYFYLDGCIFYPGRNHVAICSIRSLKTGCRCTLKSIAGEDVLI